MVYIGVLFGWKECFVSGVIIMLGYIGDMT